MEFIGDVIAAPFICIGWIIVGVLAGSIARSLTKSRDRSFILDLILGIGGALVGGLLAGVLGLGPTEDAGGLGLVLTNLVIATIGAVILIYAQRALSKS